MQLYHSLFRQYGLLWSTLCFILALAILLSLGAWQWQRKVWKEDLLQQLEAAQKGQPENLASLLYFTDPDEVRFRRLRINGTFMHNLEMHIWSPTEAGPVWRIITPLKLNTVGVGADTDFPSHILIIRGNVDDDHKRYTTRPELQPSQPLAVTGRVRFDSTNWATPAPDIKKNEWYALDLEAMTKKLKTTVSLANSAPFFVEAETAISGPPAPQPDLKQLTLNNRHLEYAVTWWGLALTLIGVYAAFIRGRLRAFGANLTEDRRSKESL